MITKKINSNWKFTKSTLGGIWEVWRNRKYRTHFDIPWHKVTLPHCFNAFDAVDPDETYYQGPGWYKKELVINNPYKNGRTILHFEGAGQITSLFIDQTFIEKHVGGYDEFKIDITDAVNNYVKKTGNNKIPIAILCDNSRNLETIPSDISDFTLYGGIYRNLRLVYTPAVSIKNLFITPNIVGEENGKISISLELYNPHFIQENINVKTTIFAPDKKVCFQDNKKIKIWNGSKEINRISLESVKKWSPEKPNLYTVEITVNHDKEQTTHYSNFGFRKFKFIKHGPFMLNGKRVLLKGTHRHEDHAGVGAAMTDNMIIKELKLIKDMGVNFIRLGHYQQSPIVLELCDKLGIMVWEEIPWCRGGLGGKEYKKQAISMLTNMITQHYNHPSIIIWGLGNENDWPGDFEDFNEKKIINFMKKLNNHAHLLDPNRKTAIRRCEFCKDIVDVYSPSIWAGWYNGLFTEYKESTEKQILEVNHFLHVEWGADNHTGRHIENPYKGLENVKTGMGTAEKDGDYFKTGGESRPSRDTEWSETYFCTLVDWHLKEQETMPTLTGTAFWPFKDFSTPVRPDNPIPYVNQKGCVQRDLRKKEGYYVFQSYWSKKPMVRIYGHDWKYRFGIKGEKKEFYVYSNMSEVELFINGKSLGKKKRDSQNFPAAGLRWKASLKRGKNTFKAVGFHKNKKIIDTMECIYTTEKWQKPSHLKLRKINSDGNTITLEARAIDSNGVYCLDSRDVVRFSVAGEAKLIDNLGTVGGSRVVEMSNGQAWIQVDVSGKAVVGVSSDTMESSFVNV